MSWVQFEVADGEIHALTSEKVDDLELAMQGRAQIEMTERVHVRKFRVDVSTFPPRLIAKK